MWLRIQQVVPVVAIVSLFLCSGALAQSGVTTRAGMLPGGATHLLEVPANWNGILFLYSHGYVVPGSKNLAQDVGDPVTQLFMLASGFALARSSYATTGWAVEQALPDQTAVRDIFNKTVGTPKHPIAWGQSLGGMVDSSRMNAAAAALGPGFHIFANSQGMIVPVPPAFVDFTPGPNLRPFDGEAEEREFESPCRER